MDPATASSLLLSTTATKYAMVASATFLLFDMVLTFDLEVSKVWKARKSLGSWLFFINRYIPPLVFAFDLYAQFVKSPSITMCKNYQFIVLVVDVLSIGVVQVVLVMRTHALYQSRSLLIWLLLGGFASLFLTLLACFVITMRYETFLSNTLIGLNEGCLPGCSSSYCRPLFIIFWIPYILFETTIFSLTAWKFYQLYTKERIGGTVQIIHIIMRDGLLYYVVILAVAIANFLVWLLYPAETLLAVGLLKSLQVTICSRLLLNLRSAMIPEESQIPSTYSQFEFAYPGNLIDPLPVVDQSSSISQARQAGQNHGTRRRQISDCENNTRKSFE